ncbi:unnamed protein product [Hymenolepis diminuta]|uniref:Uncharacterized protein n=1 Tax=Hymenolepis diminuta TaxID=6216 RepID=A0A3P7A3N1_HYMDI|nr:unnamed protein product [Hymenolepis diminuta]
MENQLKEKARDFEKKDEEMNDWLSKVKSIQTEVDTVQESLQEAISKLEETDKRATNAEAEVAAMTRRIKLLEEDFEQSSGRLTETSTKLDDASKSAEESESARWRLNNQQSADELKITELERSIESATMATQESEWKYEETRSISDDERMAQLEEQVKEAKDIAEDAERKYDEAGLPIIELLVDWLLPRLILNVQKHVWRLLRGNHIGDRSNGMRLIAIAQQSLAIAHQRAESIESTAKKLEEQLSDVAGKLKAREIAREKKQIILTSFKTFTIFPPIFSKIVELEEELRIVGNNMKSLEVSEQESLQREESYEETIRDLTERLKTVRLFPRQREENARKPVQFLGMIFLCYALLTCNAFFSFSIICMTACALSP